MCVGGHMFSIRDKKYIAIAEAYEAAFGEMIPLMMIPAYETMEGLEEKVNKSIEAGRDLLPEFYEWRDDVLY